MLIGCVSACTDELPETFDDGYVTAEECTDAGHDVIGDIGPGNTHSETFRCRSGDRPLATLIGYGTEGGVCCEAWP